MKKLLGSIFGVLMLFMFAFANLGVAYEGSHYSSGLEGAKEATILPDGFTYRMYNSFYNSNKLKDDGGNTIPGEYNKFSYALVNKVYWMSPYELLGAKYGMSLTLPINYNSLDFGPTSNTNTGIGDMLIEPFILNWTNCDQLTGMFSVGAYAPTGSFDKMNPATVGSGFWSPMVTAGGTYFFDDARTLSASMTLRWLYNFENSDVNFTRGQDLINEYEFDKVVPVKNAKVELGVAGYNSFQISDNNSNYIDGKREQLFGIGPKAAVTFDKYGLTVGAKFFTEFAVQNGSQGYKTIVSLAKSF